MLHMQSDLASSAMQRRYWNRYWCCSRPEQCRFGPVSEHFLFWSRTMRSIFVTYLASWRVRMSGRCYM